MANESSQVSNSKKLGFLSILFLGVNVIIGSGIFLMPGQVYAMVGVGSIIVVGLLLFLVLSIALCFGECASKFSQNGSAFLYSKEAFGGFVGFEVGLFTWIIAIISWVAETEGVLTAIGTIWPIMKEEGIVNTVSSVLFILIGLVNYFSINSSKWLMNLTTIAKLLPLIFFIVIGIVYLNVDNFSPIFPVDKTHAELENDFGRAMILLFYAFAGFDMIPVAAQDMKNPTKNIPRVITTIIIFCGIFYGLIVMGCIGILGKDLYGSTAPIAQATGKIFGEIGFSIITAFMIISIAGAAIAYSFVAPRSGQALAAQGLLPPQLGKLNKFGTPGIAVIISTVIAIMLSWSGGFIFLAGLSVVARFVQYIPTAIAVLIFRRRKDLPRGYRIPFGPFIPILAVGVTIWLITQAEPKKLVMGGVGLVIGAILYLAHLFLQKRLKLKADDNASVNIFSDPDNQE